MQTRKTSIRIWKPLHQSFEELVTRNGLSRDNYLNRLLRVEIPHLDREVQEPNSLQAKRYVSRALRDLTPAQLVTIRLEKGLLIGLDSICKKKNIVRDAFFNRLYFLLTAGYQVIDKVFFYGDSNWRKEVWAEQKLDGPFFQRVFFPLNGEIDPFWGIRAGLAQIYGDSVSRGEGPPDTIYDADLQVSDEPALRDLLVGLSCHISDTQIPNSRAQKNLAKTLATFTGKPASFWEAK